VGDADNVETSTSARSARPRQRLFLATSGQRTLPSGRPSSGLPGGGSAAVTGDAAVGIDEYLPAR
jgi:hypothetical protein